MRVLAHQGGWDELLLSAGVVLAFLAYSTARRRAATRPSGGPCDYCGAAAGPVDGRCPSCGFRRR